MLYIAQEMGGTVEETDVEIVHRNNESREEAPKPNVWMEGGKNVISHIYSPDGSIIINSSRPDSVGISTVGYGESIRMAVKQQITGDYIDMVMHCRNLSYNGYSDWRVANLEEVIYTCVSGMVDCSGNDNNNPVVSTELVVNGPIRYMGIYYNSISGYHLVSSSTSPINDETIEFICIR